MTISNAHLLHSACQYDLALNGIYAEISDTSLATNFDRYSPSNAHRLSEVKMHGIVKSNAMKVVSFHALEAACSGCFADA